MIFSATLLICLFGHGTLGANILVPVAVPSKSHCILIERLISELDHRGHNLTYITPFLPAKNLTNLKVIHLPELFQVMIDTVTTGSNRNFLMEMKDKSPWRHLLDIPEIGYKLSEAILQHQRVQQLINSGEKFDLILGTIIIDESVLAGFSAKFNAPIVALSTFSPGVWANYMTGNPASTSYIPDTFLGFGSSMNIWERMYNTALVKFFEIHYVLSVLPTHDAIMRKHLGSHLPPIQDILKNTSLLLVNHHHSFGIPRPYMPNMVDIGGFHIMPPKPLPKDIQELMDNSSEGVVLFSLGTNAPSSQMPKEKIDSFVRAFSRLNQNVIWKFEKDLPDLPKNIMIMKWLPQSDILAHPNLKLFITHGGLLSTTEAVERGVPVVGIPLFGDQPLNMRHTENAGLGKTMDFDLITEESVYETVSDVLNNPKYKETARAKSKLLNDNPMSAIDRAIWWVEYVLRHKGAPHLRSAAQDLAWYQLYLLDVAILAIFIILAIVLAAYYTIKLFLRKLILGEKRQPKMKEQ